MSENTNVIDREPLIEALAKVNNILFADEEITTPADIDASVREMSKEMDDKTFVRNVIANAKIAAEFGLSVSMDQDSDEKDKATEQALREPMEGLMQAVSVASRQIFTAPAQITLMDMADALVAHKPLSRLPKDLQE